MTVGTVYIGWDPREAAAYAVAEATLRRHSSIPLRVSPIDAGKLQALGLLCRPLEYRRETNQTWDVISDAPISTAFANARFFTPLLAHSGWSLFVDCDVVFFDDVARLFDAAAADDQHAVQCVKHPPQLGHATKMDGQLQSTYSRKNWSSVMMINADHPATAALTLEKLNRWPGRDLHAFRWLSNDDLIGDLAPGWNWLVGVQPRPDPLYLAHFTLGGPWLPGWKGAAHDDLWLDAEAFRASRR